MTTIQNLNIGGGGFCTGFDIAPDGTMFVRVDIFGAYAGNTTVGTVWRQTVTQAALPSDYTSSPTPYLGGGGWEVRIDPGNSNNFWLMYTAQAGRTLSALLKSTNKGVNWTLTTFPLSAVDANSGGERYESGQRIVVDPANSSVIWASNYTSLYVSQDAGATWTIVSGGSLPSATGFAGFVGLQFDPTSGTTGGKTNRLIVGNSGNGIYVSSNANLGASATWTLISGSVTNPGKGKIASDGNYYFNTQAESTSLYRLSTSNVLSTITPNAQGIACFAIDPNNPARAVFLRFGQLSFGGPIAGSPTFSGPNTVFSITATDAPWHATITPNSAPKQEGDVYFDPFVTTSTASTAQAIDNINAKTFTDLPTGLNLVAGDLIRITNTGTPSNYMLRTVASYSGTTLVTSTTGPATGGYLGGPTGGSGTFSAWTITKERLWISTGFGMFWMDGLNATASNTWNSMNLGIESLVARQVIWPTTNIPMLCTADVPVWQVPVLGSSTGLAAFGNDPSAPVVEGNAIDWVKTTPTEIVMVNAQVQSGVLFRGKNTSSGAAGSWTAFASDPGNNTIIAASDANNMVTANSTAVQYTVNGGTSWSAVPSWPTTGWSAFNGANPNYQGICADTVTAATFYGYNQNSGNIYKFVSSGPTGSTLATAINPGSGTFAPILKCAPGQAGHLFWTGGTVSGGAVTYTSFATVMASVPTTASYPLKFSNGGASWSSLANIAGVIAFGFTAAQPGQSYPAIVIAGWYNGVYGIWRCDTFDPVNPTNAFTWNSVASFARGWMDVPTTLEGNPSTWGQFIIGHNGSGFAFGSETAFGPTATFSFSVIIQGTGRLTTKMVGY